MILDKIRQVLADLYQTEDDARRMASDAGLDVLKIKFNGSAINNLHAILVEADKSDYVPVVLKIAQLDYPESLKLQAACEEYYRQRQVQDNSHDETSSTSIDMSTIEVSKTEFTPESPYGAMSPISPFYIERQADRDCRLYFEQQRAATVFVKGPCQVGKSSLMQHINYWIKIKQNVAIAYISLERFENRFFDSLESFLIELCGQIGDALNVSDEIDQYWSSRRRSALVKCSNYMTDHILPSVNKPLILAIDKLEKLLDAPFRNDFFGMLRTWHNDRAHDHNFQKISLFLSSATEPQLLIDNPTQSPFNVAQPVELHDFTLDEVQELNRRYEHLLTEGQVEKLMDLLNGHPFLTRLALHTIALQKCDIEMLLLSASTEQGPFYEHLFRFWQQISETPELTRAVRQICLNQNYPENGIYSRLRGAGLVRRINGDVVMRNTLYERFFAERLDIAS